MPYTPIKETHTPDDPLTDDMLNEIGGNFAYFKDSPEVNNVTATANMTADTINATTSLTTSTVNATTVDVTGNLILSTSPIESTLTATTTATLIPKGLYQLRLEVSTNTAVGSMDLYLQSYINGGWVNLEAMQVSGSTQYRNVVMVNSTGADLRFFATFPPLSPGLYAYAKIHLKKY